ncbi:MAG: ATPase [Candidatus Amesbacteria bacterium GW2011_GWC1_47_15]|uniref:ATPase n=2 Tax=Candidatus Amesiibacteriota TaxID=1752730 RepID=A0A0G1V4E2_9BACT|nr:MAG: ATPase [Candidatus Amesbacteria bacterium GW2011_GWC1_47_15]KKU98035.1 MAG: ATPase [Candidatus Amesbacteria bacterium GW2011_GWB1_48_13]
MNRPYKNMNKANSVVRFEGVSRWYGDPNDEDRLVRALDKISFEIESGEFVAITGPSGSGKSTLLHLIGLLDRQSEGKIFIGGVEANSLSDIQLAALRNQKIGLVFQQFNLLRRTPAIRNVELPLIYAGISRQKRYEMAIKALTDVGLENRLNNKPSQLSGGQQQRVAIARALVTNPALLLADEPTGNLDSKSGASILELFDQLHKSGVTIVMVSHDRDIAAHANRQIVIRDGRIE